MVSLKAKDREIIKNIFSYLNKWLLYPLASFATSSTGFLENKSSPQNLLINILISPSLSCSNTEE